MEGMPLASRGGPWTRMFPTNILAAAAAFTSGGLQAKPFVASGGLPTNPFATSATLALLYIDLRAGAVDGAVANAIQIKLFGTDTSNQTMSCRVWGIAKGIGLNGTTAIESWEPTLLADVLATLSAVLGVAGTIAGVADLLADTYALTAGTGNTSDIVIGNSASDVRGALFRVDFQGFDQLVIELDDGASAASVNGMFRLLW